MVSTKPYQKIWEYIRIMKYFSFFDVQVLCAIDNIDITSAEIENYLVNLDNKKIIQKQHDNTYLLIKDLGETYQANFIEEEEEIVIDLHPETNNFIDMHKDLKQIRKIASSKFH